MVRFLGLDPECFLRLMGRLHMADRGLPPLWNWFTHFVTMPYLNDVIGGASRPDRETMVAHLAAELGQRCGSFSVT